MNSGVYIITNKKNGKVYIGSTKDFERRWEDHKKELCRGIHHNSHLQHSWNKYGEKTFEFGILEYLDNLEEIHLAEQFWMDIYRMENKELYNIGRYVDCPMRGRKHTEEAKRKISKANRGKIRTEEQCYRISEAHKGLPGPRKGHVTSEEHKRKISEAMTGCRRKPLSEEHRHKISKTLMGHSVSDEARQKISEARKGCKLSEEHKRRIAEGNRGGKRTEEQRRRMSEAQKARWARTRRNNDKD